jgi:hypothetical protein
LQSVHSRVTPTSNGPGRLVPVQADLEEGHMAAIIEERNAAERAADRAQQQRKRRRSQPGTPCRCGRRWAVRPRSTTTQLGDIPTAGSGGPATATLVALLERRMELRGASLLADHLDEAVTWGI